MIKALLFNGYSNYDSDAETICSLIIAELKRNRFEVEQILIKDISIAACQGCFDCWLNTPGECRIDDYGRETTNKMVHSNLIIYITPITFGGYSSELKKVLDRFIPILLPFLTKRKGETHHKFRYKNRASIIVIGILGKPNNEKESIFKELVHRNSLNMGAPVHEVIIYIKSQSKTEFVNKLAKILKEVKVKT
ncbi:MAG: flavodoxin family protein [Promethearchaeota archaeon]